MKTMSIEKMRAALSERRLDHVANATGVKKRTIQAIISGQSTNPTYNVFTAIESYLLDESHSMLSDIDREMLSKDEQKDQIERTRRTIRQRIKASLSGRSTRTSLQVYSLISYASGYGDFPESSAVKELEAMVKSGEVINDGKVNYSLNKDKK